AKCIVTYTSVDVAVRPAATYQLLTHGGESIWPSVRLKRWRLSYLFEVCQLENWPLFDGRSQFGRLDWHGVQPWIKFGSFGLRTDGHNIFLYHHPIDRDAPMNVDFVVEVTRAFDRSGEVYPTETPAGEVAMVIHMGGYDRLRETHDTIHAWAAAHQRLFGGRSWEI